MTVWAVIAQATPPSNFPTFTSPLLIAESSSSRLETNELFEELVALAGWDAARIYGSVMETLLWMRFPGDIVFSIGAVTLALFALRLLIPRRSRSRAEPVFVAAEQERALKARSGSHFE